MSDIASVDSGLLNEDDIALAAEALDPNSSAGLLVFENVWATRFAEAVRNADGRARRQRAHPVRHRPGGPGLRGRRIRRGELRC